jgi:O-methyltransferase involved in polyketide biosynthesis
MPDRSSKILDGISETLLITLYARAVESGRLDGLIRDEKAVEIIQKIGGDFSRLRLKGHDEVAVILRMRQFDRMTKAFLELNLEATVVHIGCGLDTRMARVDDGRVKRYDLPDVIELRKKYIAERGSVIIFSAVQHSKMPGWRQ